MTVLDAAIVLYFGILWKLSGFIAIVLAISVLVIARQFKRGETEIAKKSIRTVGWLLLISFVTLMPATYYLLGTSAGHSPASVGITLSILFGISAVAFVSILPVLVYIAWQHKTTAVNNPDVYR